MRTMKASEFEAKCRKLMDEAAESVKPLVVTTNGRPIAQLRPIGRERRSILPNLRIVLSLRARSKLALPI